MSKNKFWILAVFFSFVSCSETGEIYTANIGNSWHKNESKKINFEVKNAQQPKDLTFVVANNNEYPYSNLFVISTLKNEKKQVLKTDTLQYILAEPNGKWIGEGWGDVKQTFFEYKIAHQFPSKGAYTVEIQHGMRVDNLKGIENIGIKIQNTKN